MKFIDDHISDEIAMGEPMLNESYPGGPLADPCASLVDDLTDRVEVESFGSVIIAIYLNYLILWRIHYIEKYQSS